MSKSILDLVDTTTPGFDTGRARELKKFNKAVDVLESTLPQDTPEKDTTEGMSTSQKVLAGAGKALSDTALGVRQLLTRDPAKSAALLQEIRDRKVRDKSLMSSGAGMVGAVIPQAAATAVLGGVKVLPDIALNAAIGAVQPAEDSTDRTMNTVAGGVGAGVGRAVGWGVGKGVNTLRGNWKNPAMQEVDNLAKQYNVPLSAGDLGSSFMRNLENLAGRLPGTGRTNTLTKQALSLRNMLDEQLAKFKPSAFSSGVYEDGDEAMLLADSLLKAYKEKTAVNRTLWQGLEDTLATTPTTKVRPANLRSALLPLFNKYGKQINAMPNEEAVRMLKFIAEEPGSVRNGLTFQQMREIQKGLGELSGQAERQAATGNTSRELAASIGEAYSAIMNDLDSWGRNLRNGKAHAAYKAASEDYKTSVLPYRKTPMVNKLVAMTDTDPLGDGSVLQYGVDPQQLMALLTRPSQGQLLQRIVGLSGNDGKEALQYGLLKTKLHPTFNEASGSLRPAAFGNKARQLEPQMRIYTPEQSKLVEDTTRILQAGDRANANVYHPADTVGSVLLGAAGVAHPLGAAAVLGSGDALQRGAFSKWGKNLLLASPQLVPTAVGGKLSRGLPAGAASGQGLRMYNSLIAPTDDNEWEDR